MDNSIFLDVKSILAKDKLVNMITGARGIGKTYGALKYAVDKYEQIGSTTIYLRRYKSELKKFETIFNNHFANKDINASKYEIDKGTRRKLLDKETKKPVIEAIPLSTAISFKSASFETCDFIIFDEFILDKSSIHYIQDEFELFNNFIETISRLGELTENRIVKILMLSNAGSRNNPYFIGYNIPIFKNDLYVNDDLLVYMPDQQEFKKAKEKTRWGKFVKKHTKMTEYMLEGNFKDKNDFIAQLPKKTQYIATLIYFDKKIGVYLDMNSTKLYISDKVNMNNTITYALTREDSTPNYLILGKTNRLFQMLKQYWDLGYLRFTDLKIQSIFLDILRIL